MEPSKCEGCGLTGRPNRGIEPAARVFVSAPRLWPKHWADNWSMTSQPPSYHGYRFPPEIISHAVWLYHRFCLSSRDAEDLLAQRGVTVTYETIRQ
jgi:hypothetical protein